MEWININEDKDIYAAEVTIKLIDGKELDVWRTHDGCYWSELLQQYIPVENITHWKLFCPHNYVNSRTDLMVCRFCGSISW